MPGVFVQILILLAVAVFAVGLFQRLHLPSSLGYLLVGALVGPPALGLVSDVEDVRLLAEFGIVFLLFTIGLNFSLPQFMAMRNLVFGLGASQVLLTTAAVAVLAWLAGLPAPAAFVVGAVFAQSSTTIISKQLADQAEDQTRHGRLAIGMSVFQDITAVPFIIIIPVLAAGNTGPVAEPLAWALLTAAAAFVIIFVAGRWLLRPLFHAVATRRSPELFTMTALLVSLAAAWTTQAMGLSLALGAFLAGMMLGETEFRHQVEAAIRPFRDVLLGLFFITIGMLLDPRALPDIWHWAVAGAVGLLTIKMLLVAGLARLAGADSAVAARTGIVLAVGGEFGFALIAIALDAGTIASAPAQAALTAVLLSMILAPLLIRYNGWIAAHAPLVRTAPAGIDGADPRIPAESRAWSGHVIICGYGRVGQNVARFLEQEGIEYVALDLDPARVREARTAGEQVYYGDSAQHEILEAVGLDKARALIISFNDLTASFKILAQVRRLRPELPVLVRTRDDAELERLQAAGATEVVPETLEASLMLSAHLLLILGVPVSKVFHRIREAHNDRYRFLRGFFPGEERAETQAGEAPREQLHTVTLSRRDHAVERTLREMQLDKLGVMVTAVRRRGIRGMAPTPDMRLQEGDVLVLYGAPRALERAEVALMRG